MCECEISIFGDGCINELVSVPENAYNENVITGGTGRYKKEKCERAGKRSGWVCDNLDV